MTRRLHDAPALAVRDGFDGRAEVRRRAGFDLDDDQGRAVAADEVDLAQAAAIAARDDREAVVLEIRAGGVLPPPTRREAHVSGACRAAGPRPAAAPVRAGRGGRG